MPRGRLQNAVLGSVLCSLQVERREGPGAHLFCCCLSDVTQNNTLVLVKVFTV